MRYPTLSSVSLSACPPGWGTMVLPRLLLLLLLGPAPVPPSPCPWASCSSASPVLCPARCPCPGPRWEQASFAVINEGDGARTDEGLLEVVVRGVVVECVWGGDGGGGRGAVVDFNRSVLIGWPNLLLYCRTMENSESEIRSVLLLNWWIRCIYMLDKNTRIQVYV